MYALLEGSLKPIFPTRNIAIIWGTPLIRVCEVLSSTASRTTKNPIPKKLQHDQLGRVADFYA